MIRIRHALVAVLLAAGAAACGSAQGAAKPGGAEVKELRYQGNVGSVTYPELAEDLGYLGDIKLKWVGNTTSGPQDIQSAATGQTDFGGAFNGAIIKLKAAGAPIKAVIGYYGSDQRSFNGYYVTENSPIRTARDLIGKKIGVNTLGAHHEAVIKEYLKRAGLTPQEIRQVQLVVIPPVNTEQALRQGQLDVGTLGGVLKDKALQRGGLRPLFTDIDLFGPFTAGSVVLREDFIARNPTTTRKFVEAYAKAIDWAQTHPREEVVARFQKIIAKRGRNEDATTVAFWKSTGIAGKGGVIAAKEFQTWIDWLAREGEIKPGQVKAADLYTNAYNPYANGSGS
ncbi:ABC transporter substrate-binding protein [Nonomuraea roseoviolacea]|uniref:ABC-type nitrate/sulfonate/bicarbonate transport system substrate-binding protein n=1 Tax=Nonomuraea roseoviolacea subsp. carminata TaxID=160689 RepID=A0ABT1KDL1_9ACTN|nr:ABC transporter substrate-binding protein [Nonomuraea roseoviolacea]MCP2351441.1 ABC-type nitrate/sulfonate/bicarbonate transport system substrate-binding protein [Nonomuraea roseoviolacea subsp. carminata]